VQSVEFSGGSVEAVAFLVEFDSWFIQFTCFQLANTGNSKWLKFLGLR
jgi:hypothetical protein